MTTWSRCWRTRTGILGLVAGLVMVTGAGARADTPTDHLKRSMEQVVRLLEDPALKAGAMATERRAAIRREAEDIIDFAETARRTLGPHWQSLSEADRREFVELFTDFLEQAYVSRLELYRGEEIRFVGESVDGDTATVRTRFVTRRGVEIPADYRMLRRGGRWLVYDVSVEGVSLVANYRTQFNRIIRASSYQELVRRMKSGTSELTGPGQSPGPDRLPRS